MTLALVCALLAGAASGLLACGGEPETPEAQVRALLAEVEAAAEAGDVGAFKERVSERYEDPYGHDKRALGAFVALQMMRNRGGREIVLRVRDVTLPEPTRALVVAHVGLLGSGGGLRADTYRVEFDLALEGETWRLTWAQWRRASPGELL